jgi:endoglucanase
VQDVFVRHLERHADEIRFLSHGSVAAIRNPKGSPRVIVTGHADEIGLAVHHVDDRGFLYVRPLGGFDHMTSVGLAVDVNTARGAIPGVMGRKPIHLLEPDERTKLGKIQNVFVDIGAGSKKEALSKVAIGDSITYRPGLTRLGSDLVSSKSLDNRAGVFSAGEALRRLGRTNPKACVIALSTVGEEIGGDGAFTAAHALEPDVAVAIDVTFATDQPDVSANETSEVKLGEGPGIARGPRLNPAVVTLLEAAAKKKRIPYQVELLHGRTGTDGDPIYRSRSGVPLGIVGVPCRYMHSPVEVVSLRDLDRIADLLAAFCMSLGPGTSFAPFAQRTAKKARSPRRR